MLVSADRRRLSERGSQQKSGNVPTPVRDGGSKAQSTNATLVVRLSLPEHHVSQAVTRREPSANGVGQRQFLEETSVSCPTLGAVARRSSHGRDGRLLLLGHCLHPSRQGLQKAHTSSPRVLACDVVKLHERGLELRRRPWHPRVDKLFAGCFCSALGGP